MGKAGFSKKAPDQNIFVVLNIVYFESNKVCIVPMASVISPD